MTVVDLGNNNNTIVFQLAPDAGNLPAKHSWVLTSGGESVVAISPDGQYAYVASQGQPKRGNNDGSSPFVSVIDNAGSTNPTKLQTVMVMQNYPSGVAFSL